MVLLFALYIVTPAFFILLCRKFPVLNKIGVILLMYIVGILVKNLGLLPDDADELQKMLTSVLIPLAIPMMLFSFDFRKFPLGNSLKSLLAGLIAVVISIIVGHLIFKSHLGPDSHNITGMLTGVYTGGTPNLAALKIMLDVDDNTYLLVNSYDMIVSFTHILFLITIGVKLFRRILPFDASAVDQKYEQQNGEADPYVGILKKKSLIQVLKAFGLSLTISAISVGIAYLFPKSSFMVVVILMLTTLGLVTSLWKPARKLEKSFDAGMYLIYVFSMVVASMADISKLNFSEGFYLFLFLIFIVYVSIIIQTILSKIFKIDSDLMMVTSIALISSPPFVPIVVDALKNKNVLVPGISIGIIGYALGNYLGFILSEFLKIFF